MDIDNNAIVSKTRCPALTGRVFSKPGRDVAAILADWLRGEPATVSAGTQAPPPPPPATNGNNGNGHNGDGKPQLWQTWQTTAQAKIWAKESGACANGFEANASFAKLVKEQFGGELNDQNISAVYKAFYEHQMEKLHAQAEAAAKSAPEMVPA